MKPIPNPHQREMVKVAAQIVEAAGMIDMMRPLLKRPATLTINERNLLHDAVQKASQILSEADTRLWEMKMVERESRTAVKAVES